VPDEENQIKITTVKIYIQVKETNFCYLKLSNSVIEQQLRTAVNTVKIILPLYKNCSNNVLNKCRGC